MIRKQLTITDVQKILSAQVLVYSENPETKIKMVCGSDLMSDVLAFAKPDSLLLTGLVNPQVIYTAEVAGIKTICFVRGKKPNGEIIKLAKIKNIQLLSTKLPMFESCGRLYKSGFIGCSKNKSKARGKR